MKAIEGVSRETQERLETYVELIRRWNTRIRLTGLDFSSDNPVLDSLDLGKLLETRPDTALDIGSGNGLPAIPLSIAFGIPYVLVEADGRKATFLREVAREVGCPVTVANIRVQQLAPQPYDLITARAFGSLSDLLALAYPRQTGRTVCLFPKGSDLAEELTTATRDWSFDARYHPARQGQVVEIRAITRRA